MRLLFRWSRGACRFLVFLILMSSAWATVAGAETFVVDTTQDVTDALPGDGICATAASLCTLRAAIQEANTTAAADLIRIPAGTYTIRIGGRGEDGAATGDLDITSDMVIEGTGPGVVTINGGMVDRVFDVFAPSLVTIHDLMIQNGNVDAAGGGIRNATTLAVENVTVRSCIVSQAAGGGIANLEGGNLTLVNVTLSGNQAQGAQGGGLANVGLGTINITNATIAQNTATSGGGIRNQGEVRVANSILGPNSLGGNCAGIPVISLGHNIDSSITCFLSHPTDLQNVDPKLAPLVYNGGFSNTHALQAGSPAIDGGDNLLCPNQDQRRLIRPDDGNGDGNAICDIGAFEVQSPRSPTATRTGTASPTRTMPTATPSDTPTVTPTFFTATPTQTATATQSPTHSATQLPTATATLTATNSPTTTASRTFTSSPTATLSPTLTPEPSATPSRSPSPTFTNSATASASPSLSATPTSTPSAPPGTATRTPSASRTPTATAPAATATRTATPTSAPATATFTKTPTPSLTPSNTATHTFTATARPSASPTSTLSATPTRSFSATLTATRTATASATTSPTPSQSGTPSVTATVTATPASPEILFSETTAFPGDTVSLSAQLLTHGAVVAGAQVDFTFDSLNTPVAPLATGAPDCSINPALGKQGVFVFRPFGCAGTTCSIVRGAVIPEQPATPINDAAVLFTCRFRVASFAPPIRYSVHISNMVLSDVSGVTIPGATAIDGAINVVERPTATATATVTATPTATLPVSQTPTASATATVTSTPTPPACTGDCAGDGEVTIEEIITMVRIALEEITIGVCRNGDTNGDGGITVEEIVTAVNNALSGCPAGATGAPAAQRR